MVQKEIIKELQAEKENIILKDLLYLDNKTQSEFADLIGVSNQSVSLWVRGKMPAPQRRRKVAELYPKYNVLWGRV